LNDALPKPLPSFKLISWRLGRSKTNRFSTYIEHTQQIVLLQLFVGLGAVLLHLNFLCFGLFVVLVLNGLTLLDIVAGKSLADLVKLGQRLFKPFCFVKFLSYFPTILDFHLFAFHSTLRFPTDHAFHLFLVQISDYLADFRVLVQSERQVVQWGYVI
jgi:hypothetical protein